MKDNIKILPDIEHDKFQAALANFRRNTAALSEWVAITAKLRKQAYDAHIAAGFTEAQALELAKVLPWQ